MKINLIIAGGRDFSDDYLMSEILGAFYNKHSTDDVTVLCGEARGADKMGRMFAEGPFKWMVESYPANWDKHGKAAGPLRNIQMAENATHLIAFWDGKSRGTKHMIDEATKRNLIVEVVRY